MMKSQNSAPHVFQTATFRVSLSSCKVRLKERILYLVISCSLMGAVCHIFLLAVMFLMKDSVMENFNKAQRTIEDSEGV